MARDFIENEVIYDVDGNAYVVSNNRAVRSVENSKISYYLGRSMAACFSRENPKKAEA